MKTPSVPDLPSLKRQPIEDGSPPSPPLRELARNIKKDHKAALAGLSNVMVHVFWVGVRLIEAKRAAEPKAFLRFLQSCFGAGGASVSIRMCQRYMSVAHRLSELPGFVIDSTNDKAGTRASQLRQLDELGVLSIRQVLRREATSVHQTLPLSCDDRCPGDRPRAMSINRAAKQADTGSDTRQLSQSRTLVLPSGSDLLTAAERPEATDDDDHLLTPKHIIEPIVNFFNDQLDLDPCASANQELWLPAKTSRTADDDSLSDANVWHGRVFVHPPLRSIEPWVTKAVAERDSGHAHEIILLLPAITDAEFNAPIQPYPRAYFRSRISFATPTGSVCPAATAYMLVYLGEESRFEDFAYAVGGYGDVYFAFRFV